MSHPVVVEISRPWQREIGPPIVGVTFNGVKAEDISKEDLLRALYISVESSEEWRLALERLKRRVYRSTDSGLAADKIR